MTKVRVTAFEQFKFTRVDPRLRDVWLRRLVANGLTCDDFPSRKIPKGLVELLKIKVD